LRWKRYEKQRPRPPAASRRQIHRTTRPNKPKQKYYQFTAIDECTRLRVLRAYPRCDQKTAIAFIDHTLSKLPFAVERVKTDNGSEFGASFHWRPLDNGIDHVKIKPATPRPNGKVEGSAVAGYKRYITDDTAPSALGEMKLIDVRRYHVSQFT
jgi:Integrase core domain